MPPASALDLGHLVSPTTGIVTARGQRKGGPVLEPVSGLAGVNHPQLCPVCITVTLMIQAYQLRYEATRSTEPTGTVSNVEIRSILNEFSELLSRSTNSEYY